VNSRNAVCGYVLFPHILALISCFDNTTFSSSTVPLLGLLLYSSYSILIRRNISTFDIMHIYRFWYLHNSEISVVDTYPRAGVSPSRPPLSTPTHSLTHCDLCCEGADSEVKVRVTE